MQLRRVNARGLFAQDVQTCPERRLRKRRMQLVRRGNQHGVARMGADERHAVGIDARSSRKRLLRPVTAVLARISDAGQRNFRRLPGQDEPAVLRAHVANADDAEANLLHPDFLLGTGYFLVLPKLPETSMAASTSSLWRDVLRFSFSSFKNSSSSTGSETV